MNYCERHIGYSTIDRNYHDSCRYFEEGPDCFMHHDGSILYSCEVDEELIIRLNRDGGYRIDHRYFNNNGLRI